MNTEQIVHLNGGFLPISDAKISVLDRGFIYGDGVYEVVPVYKRRPFRMAQHLARLQYSLDGVRMRNPHSDAQWTALIEALVARQPFDDQAVYLQVTRGVAKRDHAFPAGVEPTVFMMSNPLPVPTRDQVEKRRGRRHGRGQPVASLRPEDHVAARQRADAPARGGLERGRDGDVPRRHAHRGVRVQRARRAQRHGNRAAEGST